MTEVKTNPAIEAYLVGGAVRDQLLNYTFKERDWVVIGSTPEEMLSLGFQQVGKDFPVFLHPETHDEYALARTERKDGLGYHGFEMHASPDVTLEEDLYRRDLTINAMAMTESGEIIDPYGGQADLETKTLRHVSSHFSEDPLRLLRVARFAARFHHLGFSIADDTMELLKEITESQELKTLSVERVWTETDKALSEQDPDVYFQVLRDCGALKQLFPEIDALFGVPNPVKWHPEVDSGIHTLMVLKQAALLSPETKVRFAALCHDLGKGLTPKEFWPKHRGHERAGVGLIKKMADRLKIPNEHRDLACLGSEFHLHAHKALELRPQTLLKVLTQFDFFRRPERFNYFLDICEADFRGRTGYENKHYPQRDYFEHIAKLARQVKIDQEHLETLKGKARGDYIEEQRLTIIRRAKESYVAQQVE